MIRVWRVVVVDFQVQNLESCERSQDIECAGSKDAFEIWVAFEQDMIVFSRNLSIDDLRYSSILFIVLDTTDKRQPIVEPLHWAFIIILGIPTGD